MASNSTINNGWQAQKILYDKKGNNQALTYIHTHAQTDKNRVVIIIIMMSLKAYFHKMI